MRSLMRLMRKWNLKTKSDILSLYMKRIFAISLIISIATLAGFGAFAMNHASEHGHVGCLSAAAPVPECPAGDMITMFLFHAGILKSLLLAVASFFAAFALIILTAVALTLHERAGPFLARPFPIPLFFIDPLVYSRAPIARWLALHENSPSYA